MGYGIMHGSGRFQSNFYESRERAATAVELIIVFLTFMMICAAVFELGDIAYTKHLVSWTAEETARKAASARLLTPAIRASLESDASASLTALSRLSIAAITINPPADLPSDGTSDFMVQVRIDGSLNSLFSILGMPAVYIGSESVSRYEWQLMKTE